MRSPSLAAVFAPLLLAGVAVAQLYTTTVPVVDGDTLVISTGTNALGLPTTATVRTLTSGLTVTTPTTGLVTTPTTGRTTVTTPTTRNTLTTTNTRTTQGNPNTQTTGQRVGQDTALPPPMRTTTYWYDTGMGYWTVGTWTASITALPTVATALVPAGTLQDYNQYQTSVNSRVLASAQASASRAAGQARANIPVVGGNVMGWVVMGVGAVLGAGVLAL